LVTLSGQPCSFLVGGEQAVPVPAGLGAVGVQFEEFGTRINFLPVVLDSGRINLEVAVETSTAADRESGRGARRKQTTAELEPGQSMVLGGEGWIVLVTPVSLVPEEEAEQPRPRQRTGREGLLREVRWWLLTAGGAF
jgi:hypothetical protein